MLTDNEQSKEVIIGTHNGFFHADDCLAVAALTLIFPKHKIIRSRDKQILDECDFLVDVGGIYNDETNRFDHHFSNGPTYDDGLLMSSFGLVWKKYGEQICGSREIMNNIKSQLVRPVDAADNGVAIHCRQKGAPEVNMLSLSAVLAVMNPSSIEEADDVVLDQVVWCRKLITRFIANARQRIDSREVVRHAFAYAEKKNTHFMELPSSMKWEEALYTLDKKNRILFVVFPHNKQWYLRCVSRTPHSYTPRKRLPSDWAGLRDDDFSRTLGINDGVFCHHAAFVCAAKSRDSILKIAEMALSYNSYQHH